MCFLSLTNTSMPEIASSVAEEGSLVVHQDVSCPGCGCLCDDLQVSVRGDQLARIEPPCPLAEVYFRAPQVTPDACLIDGRPATIDEAITAAAVMLRAAEAPLFFGLGETTSETVRKIVDLADRTGGILDAAHPSFFDPTGRLLQTTGLVTCSLGEIRHRADQVIFWGCDLEATHPRHGERYSIDPVGRFVPQGRAGRHLVGIGSGNSTTAACDMFLPLEPEQQIDALHLLNCLAEGKPYDAPAMTMRLGDQAESLAVLHEQVSASKYFVFVLGEGFLRRGLGRIPLELLARYVRTLHERTRGAISICRPGPNWVGAAGVVASRTGYPGGASLTQGVPRFDPDNGSAAALLAQGRVDAAVFLEGPWLDQLPPEAAARLREIPTVILAHRPVAADGQRMIFIPIARPGWGDGGIMSRLDDQPLPVRRLARSGEPSAREAIEAILRKLESPQT